MPRSVHLLCGAGGDSTGLAEAGFDPMLGINHWQTAVDTFSANHPHAAARCADIANYPMRWLPRAVLLWASVICREISPAGGRRRAPDPAQLDLFAEDQDCPPPPPEAFEQTRVTGWCVVRAAEAKRYPAVVVENVLEFLTDWPLSSVWIKAMTTLGYQRPLIICASSAHIGDDRNVRAPQWRDRVYIVFLLEGIRRPVIKPRPLAYCPDCGDDVRAVQTWRNPRVRIGRYGVHYDYRCPRRRCGHHLVEPYVRPAADIIDWSDIGQRIGDRARPLAPNTMRRIREGFLRYPLRPSVVTLTHGRDGKSRAFAPEDRPLPTRTQKQGEALLVPTGGSWNTDASSVAQPMRTRTTRESEALVTPGPIVVEMRRNATGSPVENPLTTLTAQGRHHALAVPEGRVPDQAWNTLVIPYRKAAPRTAAEPLHTLGTRSSAALVAAQPRVEDCHFRMLQPIEQLMAQRFPRDYIVCGTKTEQTMQAGNAVSVNVARWLGEQLLPVLT